MKTFQQFKEEVKKKTFEPLKQFGQNFAKEAENFANSKEAENYIWDKKRVSNWDVIAVNENA